MNSYKFTYGGARETEIGLEAMTQNYYINYSVGSIGVCLSEPWDNTVSATMPYRIQLSY